MKKLLTSALLAAFLSGCGAHGVVGTARVSSATAAQSKAGVEKGIHAMFRAAFVAADKNEDKKLTVDEMPVALPQAPIPGAPVPPSLDAAGLQQAQKDMLARLDFNRDGVVTYREFARPDDQAQAMIFYRTEIAKLFNTLDKNGDHALTEDEVAGEQVRIGRALAANEDVVAVAPIGSGDDEPTATAAPAAVADTAVANPPVATSVATTASPETQA